MKIICMLLLLSILPSTLFSCIKTEYEPDGKPEYRVVATAPAQGDTVNLLGEDIGEFVKNYTSDFDIGTSDDYYGRGDNYRMKTLTLAWSCKEAGALGYEITLASTPDFGDARIYESDKCELEIDYLIPDTVYYWYVSARYADKIEKSAVNTFVTARTPRTVYIDGVSNSRDIGGLLCEGGKYISYGKVYRAASLDNITDIGRDAFLGELGIKTDLDLRKDGEGTAGNGSPVGDSVNYIHTPGAPYYNGTTGISRPEFQSVLADEIRTFADSRNYPIMIHCSIGRDRTGTLVFILEALCGASFNDIMRDYELSFFSEAGCRDKAEVSKLTGYMINVLGYINRFDGDTLAEQTASFLKSIGITDSEISAIRNNMTE